MSVRTLTIDEAPLSAGEDQSILDVCRENGIPIPTLCHLEGLSEIGACRLCLVEVEGSAKLLPACTTQVQEGMVIRTASERLKRYRRQIVELLFAEGGHVCAICMASGSCELQDLAYRVGMDHVRFAFQHPSPPLDASHPRFVHDPTRCVLCTRCVRVCDEIEGAHTWDVAGRGARSRVVTDLATPWGQSDSCTACGKCVQVCPTGALFEKGRWQGGIGKNRDFLAYIKTAREKKQWIK